MTALNLWSDVSSIAITIQENALFVIRETYQAQNWVTVRGDMRGANLRKIYQYNQLTADVITETDDMTSVAFTPALLGTLTPAIIGKQIFVTDLRRDSEAPEDIIRDGAAELAYAAGDKVETDVLSDFSSLTGGTIGTAGSTITWGYVAAAIAVARGVNKSANVPLVGVLHGYQAAVLAKTASVAGATTVAATGVADEMTRQGFGKVFQFMGIPLYQVFAAVDGNDDFRGAVFPKTALMMDWRKPISVEAQRDASRIGTEFNMSAVYAHGVYRPALGVSMIFDAAKPTS